MIARTLVFMYPPPFIDLRDWLSLYELDTAQNHCEIDRRQRSACGLQPIPIVDTTVLKAVFLAQKKAHMQQVSRPLPV